jgi:ADP-dependent NAD(P)H-hydrate dehydratase / NAD(P)H-hydrate epimerase
MGLCPKCEYFLRSLFRGFILLLHCLRFRESILHHDSNRDSTGMITFEAGDFKGGSMQTHQVFDDHILLTPDETRQADAWAIENGVSSVALMEAAGRAVAEIVVDYIGTPLEVGGEVVVLCGPGNNGGDGYVIARHLEEWGYPVRVLTGPDADNATGSAGKMAARWQGISETIGKRPINGAAVIVDSLFGTGLNKPVEGAFADILDEANKASAFRLAVDVPSGLDALTGNVLGTCFRADATVTFFHKKSGQMVAPGRFYCGGTDHLHVADIGIPSAALEDITPSHFANQPELWSHAYPFQGPASHKYDRGHLLVLGGKEPTLGASRLASMAALRTGAGLVTLAASSDTYPIQAGALDDVMVRKFDSAFGFIGILSDPKINTVLLGPGAGVGEKTAELVLQAAMKGRSLVLDADALTSLVGRLDVLGTTNAPAIVLTPHEGEFSRLFPKLDFKADRISATRRAAKISGCTVVLKGVSTVTAAADGRVSIAGNAPSWLAVGGTGDVLAGMIGSLLAQGMTAFEAASAAVWLHGEAGMKAGRGLIASDLLVQIPKALP